MKKCVSVFLMVCMMSVVLSGCGNALSTSFDRDTVQNSAENFISLLNDRDYDDGYAMFSQLMKDAISREDFESTFEPMLDEKGTFIDYKNQQISGTSDKESGAEYAVCIFTAEYENGDVTYTITYNTSMKVDGIYYR